jgi:hypothetical protein
MEFASSQIQPPPSFYLETFVSTFSLCLMIRPIRVSALFFVASLTMQVAPAAIIFTSTLNGSNEVPPTGSAATGSITVILNGNLLSVNETFTGLTNPATAAHIHCCAPVGTNVIVAVPFTGFPAATSGSYMNTFDLTMLSTYNSAFVTANGGTASSAEAAFITGLESSQAYANIHDSTFPGGEIRGQLTPEPATWAIMALGLSFLGVRMRRSRAN